VGHGHFAREVETVFRPYLASHCSGATEIKHLALLTHAVEAVQVLSKSHFARGTESVFRLYLAWLCSGVTETSHLTLHTLTLKAVQVWSKWIGNEGHFSHDTGGVLRLCLTSLGSRVT
jgi:hypothetical protein